jgi:NitT/TauT family transport system substrate-binding protein
LWKKLGLDVELLNYQDDEDFRAAIMGGAIDLGFDMTAASIDMIRKGSDQVIYAETNWSHGGDKIILANGMTAKGLAGGKVGIYDEGAAVNLLLDAWLTREGVDPAAVERVVMEDEGLANAYAVGAFKAIINYEPQASRALKEGGGTFAATTADFPGVMPEGIAGKRGLDPASLEKFFTGLLQGTQIANDPANRAAVVVAVNKHLFSAEAQTADAIVEQLAAIKLHGAAECLARNRDATGLVAFIAQVQAWNTAHGHGAADLAGRVDTSAIQAAAKALISK